MTRQKYYWKWFAVEFGDWSSHAYFLRVHSHARARVIHKMIGGNSVRGLVR